MTYTLLFQKEDTVANFNGITTGTGAITLTTGNFSVSGTQLFVIDGDTTNAEVVLATVSGTTMTLSARGQDNTSAVTHAAGCKVGMYFVPSHYGDLGKIADNSAWTAWAPTFTGFSVDPTVTARYMKLGKTIYFRMLSTADGTSNASGFTFTLPETVKTGVNIMGIYAKNGAAGFITARLQLATGSNIATLYTSASGGSWNTSGDKFADVSIVYEAE